MTQVQVQVSVSAGAGLVYGRRKEDGEITPPMPGRRAMRSEPEIALCPNSRSAQIYALEDDRRQELSRRAERIFLENGS